MIPGDLIVTDIGPRTVKQTGFCMACFSHLVTTYRVSDGHAFINVSIDVEGIDTTDGDALHAAEEQAERQARMAWANHFSK